MRLRIAVTSAAKFRATENQKGQEHHDSIKNLKEDLVNCGSHIFREHKNCATIGYFSCNPDPLEVDWVPAMVASGIYADIMKHIQRLINNAKNLLYMQTNTCVEVYHSVLAKFTGGKRINFSRRNSYKLRCEAAVLSFNEKGNYHQIIQQALSPGTFPKYLLKYTEGRNKSFTKEIRIRRRKVQSAPADQHYGPQASSSQTNDLNPMEYEKKEEEFISTLKLNQSEIERLELETRGQSTCQAWQNARISRITASNMGKICKLRKTTNPSKTIRTLLYPTFINSEATLFGKLNEGKAILDFSKIYNLNVEPCGIFIDPVHYYLGATPDGVIGDNIIEVKCLAKYQNETPMTAVLANKVPCAKIVNGNCN